MVPSLSAHMSGMISTGAVESKSWLGRWTGPYCSLPASTFHRLILLTRVPGEDRRGEELLIWPSVSFEPEFLIRRYRTKGISSVCLEAKVYMHEWHAVLQTAVEAATDTTVRYEMFCQALLAALLALAGEDSEISRDPFCFQAENQALARPQPSLRRDSPLYNTIADGKPYLTYDLITSLPSECEWVSAFMRQIDLRRSPATLPLVHSGCDRVHTL